jgi:hypothetical protein
VAEPPKRVRGTFWGTLTTEASGQLVGAVTLGQSTADPVNTGSPMGTIYAEADEGQRLGYQLS